MLGHANVKTDVRIRLFDAADIPFGLRLCAQNHWNQLVSDWQRQLALQPDGCFVAESLGEPVGTACACIFERDAWINLVLVESAQRSRGIGSMLLRHVIAWLDTRGVRSIWLDATPMGQPVYAKLGFVGVFGMARWQGVVPDGGGSAVGVEPLLANDIPDVCAIDERATGFRRASLLHRLFAADPGRMRKVVTNGAIAGYCMCRPGANAWQIGSMQGSPQACAMLLADAVQRFAGERVYLDVPDDNSLAIASLQAKGFTVQRPFLRMVRGEVRTFDLTLHWSSFGPEKG
ncbi:MAG: GNAT family N-acetyltransferase [Gemmataceae bacterium]|nr:GNAT family N-acetyltransferase [Gemmataceae bacterium]